MEVLSRPKVPPRFVHEMDIDSTLGTPMLVAPSPVTRLPPRLPPSEHRLTIPVRPSIASRRHSATIGPMSPSHLSRPLRSSPLAGPSIAASLDDMVVGPASAPATPGGGCRHLSPLAEFSSTPEEEPPRPAVVDAETKKQRRRTIGSVLSKLSFPASSAGASVSEPPSSPPLPTDASTEGRRRTRSTTSRDAPPVPPVPAWVHHSLPSRSSPTRSSRYAQPSPSPSSSSATYPSSPSPSSSSSSSRPLPRPHTAGSYTSPQPRPTSPTPSARSANSALQHKHKHKHAAADPDPRRASPRPPSTSRRPEENWLTQSAAPRFSRLGLKAEGVVLPVSAKEARRRSTASLASLGRGALEPRTPPPPLPLPVPVPTRAGVGVGAGTEPPASQSQSQNQNRFRSRASSRTSLASAASGVSADCDTPSLTMSPGPSASDVSLGATETDAGVEAEADEMGVLPLTLPIPGRVEVRVNDVRVGVLAVPAPVYAGKGKEREGGGLAQWARGGRGRGRESANGSTPSLLSSAATSVADVPFGGAPSPLHVRAATAPDLLVRAAADADAEARAKAAKGTGKRSRTLGRVWKQVVRSVTVSRR